MRVARRFPRWAAPAAAGAGAVACCAVVVAADPRDGGLGQCPFLAVTGLWCPGCGALRATYSLAQLDVAAAASYNLLFVAAVPFLLWAWAAWVTPSTVRRPDLSARSTVLVAVTLVMFAVARNVPAAPFAWLAPG